MEGRTKRDFSSDDEKSGLVRRRLKRQNAIVLLEDEELPPVTIYQKFINGLMACRPIVCSCSRSSQYMLWLPLFGSLVGIIMAIRGGIDGQLSFIGSWLRIIYFTWFALVNLTERKFDVGVRVGNALPNISGFFLTVVQLYGIMKDYKCEEWSSKCL